MYSNAQSTIAVFFAIAKSKLLAELRIEVATNNFGL
jgi:hypothetical protein